MKHSISYNDTMMVASMTIEQLKAEFLLIEQKQSPRPRTQRDLIVSRLQWEATKDPSILHRVVQHKSFVTKKQTLWNRLTTLVKNIIAAIKRVVGSAR